VINFQFAVGYTPGKPLYSVIRPSSFIITLANFCVYNREEHACRRRTNQRHPVPNRGNFISLILAFSTTQADDSEDLCCCIFSVRYSFLSWPNDRNCLTPVSLTHSVACALNHEFVTENCLTPVSFWHKLIILKCSVLVYLMLIHTTLHVLHEFANKNCRVYEFTCKFQCNSWQYSLNSLSNFRVLAITEGVFHRENSSREHITWQNEILDQHHMKLWRHYWTHNLE
jgi:hypothetical protein